MIPWNKWNWRKYTGNFAFWLGWNRGQAAAALILTASGIATASLSEHYVPVLAKPEIQEEIPEEPEEPTEGAPRLQIAAETEESQESEAEYEPSPSRLNLAYYFPEGADSSDVMESYAGKVYEELTVRDSEWMAEIYDLGEISPANMASRLNRPAASVCGQYNPNDENQDPKRPETWIINDWKKINISLYNGSGKRLNSYSNVKDILSMASVYTYQTDIMNVELFQEYAEQLWDHSHSYSVSMSNVYYCDGCLDKSEEELLAEEEEEELSDGLQRVEEKTSEEPAETFQTIAAEAEREPQIAVEEETLGGTIRKSTVDPTQWDHVGPGEEPVASPGNAQNIEETSTEGMILEEITLGQEAPQQEEAESQELTGEPVVLSYGSCPGHVDLNISIRILGLEEENGLIKVDEIGNKESAGASGEESWSGWNEDSVETAKALASQDWYQEYGLSISTIHMRDPLSSGEIDAYMDLLPEDVSEERRNIIKFALSSVGKVPYYWGGKASHPGYEGNAFGALVSSDTEGRIFKGLDCSGWVSWVYWSVTGSRLDGESTSSLALCGRAISREELQPGDIILKTGTGAHVVMFLNWAENGQMQVIHESSTAVNNVTIKTMAADWPYYRNLLD